MGAVVLLVLCLALGAAVAAVSAAGARPSAVAVGFTYESTIGHAARLAVDDVNADRTVLAGTKLNLITQDTNCSGFLRTIEEYPYFLRSTLSDYVQMHAVASTVDYYQWKEVTAIFVDDDYGRGGVSALSHALAAKQARISYKAAIPPNSNTDVINDVLFKHDGIKGVGCACQS